MHKLTARLLVLILMLSLCGCGSASSKAKLPLMEAAADYIVTPTELKCMDGSIVFCKAFDGAVYALTEKSDGSFGLCVMNAATGLATQIEGFSADFELPPIDFCVVAGYIYVLTGRAPTNDESVTAQYAAKGYLEDLYPYIDSNMDIRREDFVAPVLSVLEQNAKLYELWPEFGVATVVGKSELLGDGKDWSEAKLRKVSEGLQEDVSLFGESMTRDDFLSFAVSFNMDSFVDWEKKSSDFEGEEFAEILACAKGFPTEISFSS